MLAHPLFFIVVFQMRARPIRVVTTRKITVQRAIS